MPKRQRPVVVAKSFVDFCDPPWITAKFIDEVKGNFINCLYTSIMLISFLHLSPQLSSKNQSPMSIHASPVDWHIVNVTAMS